MARRRFQRGTVRLRGIKHKVWIGRYREDVIFPGGKRRVCKTVILGTLKDFPTKRLAERSLEMLLFRINAATYRGIKMATISEFAEKWESQVLEKQKPSSIHAAKSHLKIQILPMLGKLRLDDLGVENQQRFVNQIAGTVARKTLLNVLGTLSSMLKTAKNWGYVTDGVSLEKLAVPDQGIRTEPRCFTPEQARMIISAASGQYRVMFAIAAMTGLRAGEILGLMAEDFDFANGLMHVRRSVWRGKLQAPKTARSQATLPLPGPLSEIIKDYVLTRPGFLFLTQRGTHPIAENVVRQALVPILDALKIPRCGFHAFRHCHSSLLLSSGAAPTVTQRQLRHSDARITLGVYGHLIGQEHREAVSKVAEILRPIAPNSIPQGKWIQ